MSKERLVDLHVEAVAAWDTYLDMCEEQDVEPEKTFDEFVADYLIANGVIVPPCKVGDKLYRVVELFNGEKFVVEGEALEYAETLEIGTVKKRIYFRAKGESFPIRNYSLWFEISEIGKTVFLTREEAEKKLKENETHQKV